MKQLSQAFNITSKDFEGNLNFHSTAFFIGVWLQYLQRMQDGVEACAEE